MYNRGAYNRTPYNRIAVGESWGAAAARLRLDAAGVMTAELALRGQADARMSGTGIPLWQKPMSGAEAGMLLNGSRPTLKIEVPIAARTAAMLTGGSFPVLQLYSSDDLTLEGLSFGPGDELIIDTDNVTAELNGESVIRLWKAGSVPLRLAPGENVLIWTDDGIARQVSCTVVWKDRWI